MADYLSNTPNQQAEMLKELGFNSLEDLYQNLPQDLSNLKNIYLYAVVLQLGFLPQIL